MAGAGSRKEPQQVQDPRDFTETWSLLTAVNTGYVRRFGGGRSERFTKQEWDDRIGCVWVDLFRSRTDRLACVKRLSSLYFLFRNVRLRAILSRHRYSAAFCVYGLVMKVSRSDSEAPMGDTLHAGDGEHQTKSSSKRRFRFDFTFLMRCAALEMKRTKRMDFNPRSFQFYGLQSEFDSSGLEFLCSVNVVLVALFADLETALRSSSCYTEGVALAIRHFSQSHPDVVAKVQVSSERTRRLSLGVLGNLWKRCDTLCLALAEQCVKRKREWVQSRTNVLRVPRIPDANGLATFDDLLCDIVTPGRNGFLDSLCDEVVQQLLRTRYLLCKAVDGWGVSTIVTDREVTGEPPLSLADEFSLLRVFLVFFRRGLCSSYPSVSPFVQEEYGTMENWSRLLAWHTSRREQDRFIHAGAGDMVGFADYVRAGAVSSIPNPSPLSATGPVPIPGVGLQIRSIPTPPVLTDASAPVSEPGIHFTLPPIVTLPSLTEAVGPASKPLPSALLSSIAALPAPTDASGPGPACVTTKMVVPSQEGASGDGVECKKKSLAYIRRMMIVQVAPVSDQQSLYLRLVSHSPVPRVPARLPLRAKMQTGGRPPKHRGEWLRQLSLPPCPCASQLHPV